MSNRKLQGSDNVTRLAEIDRTLKKISEGIEIFDGVIEKLHGNISNNQKEKLELELKKEIKKLQRHRDQIKNWLALNEIKDKDILLETRRLIELQMEKFKVCEKEMKTKAYSKEGLSQAAKLDPKEKEKLAMAGWLTSAVDRLFTQINVMEAEIESLELALKKTKKPESSKVERQSSLESRIEAHKVHMDKLEVLLRMLENGNFHVDKLNSFKEDMEYYIESNSEPDFVEDLAMYDDFDLTEQNSDDEESESDYSDAFIKEEDSSKTLKEEVAKPPLKASTSTTSTPTIKQNPIVKPPTITTNPKKLSPPLIPATQPSNVEIISPAQVWSNAPKSVVSEVPKDKRKVDVRVESIPHKPEPSFSEVLAAGLKPEASFASIAAPNNETKTAGNIFDNDLMKLSSFLFSDLKKSFEELKSKQSKSEKIYFQQAVENSFMNIPDAIELDRNRKYAPKNPCGVPSYYPQKPPVIFENPAIFERFDTDTLFFIFYYQQKTLQQYFAARELKKQSWRFHKKYLTWFQRHEEPKAITDEYEQGTYIYFDYEGSWCQRKKTEFTFEYRYLEDAELALLKRVFGNVCKFNSARIPFSTATKVEVIADLNTRPTSPAVQSLITQILSLSLLDTAALVKQLKIELNISDASMMPAIGTVQPVATPVAAAAPVQEPEKTEFKVILEKFDAAGKAKIIREIKTIIPSMNLVEAKNFVEGAPKTIKEKVKKEDAEKIKKTLEELGATIKLE